MRRPGWRKPGSKTDRMGSQSLVDQVREQITPYTETPYLDTLVLLSHLLDIPRAQLLAHPSPPIKNEQGKKLISALKKIRRGFPLPYVVGKWEFFSLDFFVNPDVLIPRPETERLVEEALHWLKNHPQANYVLDVGTGSGCLAVALSVNQPRIQLIAADISLTALLTARKNAAHHHTAERIHFVQMDLLSGLSSGFDLICANLPYIPSHRLPSLAVTRREPLQALDGGPDGLHLIRRLLKEAGNHLNPGGAVLLEIDEKRGDLALETAGLFFPEAVLTLEKDLSGKDRYLWIQT